MENLRNDLPRGSWKKLFSYCGGLFICGVVFLALVKFSNQSQYGLPDHWGIAFLFLFSLAFLFGAIRELWLIILDVVKYLKLSNELALNIVMSAFCVAACALAIFSEYRKMGGHLNSTAGGYSFAGVFFSFVFIDSVREWWKRFTSK